MMGMMMMMMMIMRLRTQMLDPEIDMGPDMRKYVVRDKEKEVEEEEEEVREGGGNNIKETKEEKECRF